MVQAEARPDGVRIKFFDPTGNQEEFSKLKEFQGLAKPEIKSRRKRDPNCRLAMIDPVEEITAPAAIERVVGIYQKLMHRDHSVLLQVRKILTQYIYGLVDRGESDERRLVLAGLAYLKEVERDHNIKSARD
jgi:hypothetical protein